MKITKVKISELKQAEYNPRRLTKKQYEDLKASLEKFGLVDPIIINSDNTVIGGHQRLKIVRELGGSEVPTVRVNLSKEDERELNIRLNKNTGEFDLDILANNFDVDELKDWGFKDVELGFNIDKIVEGNIEDDHIPELKETRVKLGEVWELGKHRLMCGDSTKENDVNKLMNGNKADMVFTDPPYDFTEQSYNDIIKNNTENAHIFVMNDDRGIVEYLKQSELEFLRFFVADFIFASPRGNDPYLNHILISQEKKGSAIKHQNLYDGFSSIIKMKYRGTIKNEDILHKHQKPIDFVENFIKHFSIDNYIVLDLFLGSGSTLIACEKTNRTCYGMELDTKYCDVIIERWEQFTKQKAKKI